MAYRAFREKPARWLRSDPFRHSDCARAGGGSALRDRLSVVLCQRGTAIAYYGVLLSALALLALFFGQRMAKEYPGAATLVPYFLLALAGLYFLA